MGKHALWTASFQCLAKSLTLPLLPKGSELHFFIKEAILQNVHITLLSVTPVLLYLACLMILKQDTKN